MQNKLFLKAADICELLEVKQTSAYEIIGNLNKELEEQGFHSLKIMECCSYTHDTSLPSYLSMILIAPFLQKLTYNSPYLLFIILWRKILLNFILF